MVVVHVGGLIVPDVAEIAAFCAERGLPLLEDAAHAHGARLGGRPAGSLGTAGSFSFFPTKVMTTGEGGMLTTDDDGLAEFARSFRCHGIGPDRLLVRPGANHRLPELSAALGLRQLARLEQTLAEREALARRYDAGLDALGGAAARFPVARPPAERHAWYKYPVTLGEGREGSQPPWAPAGSPWASLYWPPCHLQPSARDRLGTGDGDCPARPSRARTRDRISTTAERAGTACPSTSPLPEGYEEGRRRGAPDQEARGRSTRRLPEVWLASMARMISRVLRASRPLETSSISGFSIFSISSWTAASWRS